VKPIILDEKHVAHPPYANLLENLITTPVSKSGT
jgi:hypothetical protein